MVRRDHRPVPPLAPGSIARPREPWPRPPAARAGHPAPATNFFLGLAPAQTRGKGQALCTSLPLSARVLRPHGPPRAQRRSAPLRNPPAVTVLAGAKFCAGMRPALRSAQVGQARAANPEALTHAANPHAVTGLAGAKASAVIRPAAPVRSPTRPPVLAPLPSPREAALRARRRRWRCCAGTGVLACGPIRALPKSGHSCAHFLPKCFTINRWNLRRFWGNPCCAQLITAASVVESLPGAQEGCNCNRIPNPLAGRSCPSAVATPVQSVHSCGHRAPGPAIR